MAFLFADQFRTPEGGSTAQDALGIFALTSSWRLERLLAAFDETPAGSLWYEAIRSANPLKAVLVMLDHGDKAKAVA